MARTLTAPRTDQAAKPVMPRTIPAKDKAKASATRVKPARTPGDWKAEEANETDAKSLRGASHAQPITVEQCVVGDVYSIGNWGHPSWVDEDGDRLTVSFWFPTQKAAIDYPDTEVEFEKKTEAFKKLKVAYVGVLPGEPLRVEDAREQLKEQGASIKI